MVCITLKDTKETQNWVLKIERKFKESSKARMVLANRNIPRVVCVHL